MTVNHKSSERRVLPENQMDISELPDLHHYQIAALEQAKQRAERALFVPAKNLGKTDYE